MGSRFDFYIPSSDGLSRILGGRLLYQLWTYDKSQKFLFKMENFFKSEKVAEK